MNFTRASQYHEVSDCGQYTCCWVSGMFEAWFGKQQLEVSLSTAEDARNVCRSHKAQMRNAA